MFPKNTLLKEYLDKYEKYLLPLLPAIAVTIFFARSLNYSFLQMDDYSYVLRNQHLALSWSNIVYWLENPCIGLYTPLQMFSYIFDYTIWGHNPFGYHLQNILWHIIVVSVIYYLFIELGFSARTGCLLSILYAIHPQRIESVVWIAERKDVMMGAFYFLALLVWMKSIKKGKNFSPLAFSLMICTCLTKPAGVTIPAVMLLLLIYYRRSFRIKEAVVKLWPYIVVGSSYVIFKLAYLHHIARDFTAPEKDFARTILMVGNNFMIYAGKTFFPGELIPLYPFFEPSTFDIAIIILFYLMLIICGIFLIFHCNKVFLYQFMPPVLCFVITLLPIVGIFSFSNTDFADRYSYIPAFFILWLVAVLATKIHFSDYAGVDTSGEKIEIFWPEKYRIVATLIAVIYLISLMLNNYYYMPSWENGYALYQKICDRKNANYRAMTILAAGEMANNNIQDAARLAENIQPKPWMTNDEKNKIILLKDYFETMLLVSEGNDQVALSRLLRLYENDRKTLGRVVGGGNEEVLSAIIKIYIKQGNKSAASNLIMKHAESLTVPSDMFFYRGLAAFLRDDLSIAHENFVQALKLSPDNPQIKANLLSVERKISEKSVKK